MPSTRGDAAIDGTTADKCMMGEIINGTRIEFDYLDSLQFSELGLPDRALLFHLANPDSTDAGLNFVVTTDGPLKVLPSNNGTDVCASLANSNIVGTFILDYAIVRGMAASDPLVAAGTWELGWNKRGIGAQAIFEKYGLEVTGCSTDDPMSGCTPSRQSAQQPQQPQWCIPARTGDSTSIKMRLWASPAPGVKSYGINLSAQWSATGPPIVLDADGHRGPTFKVVASQTSIPIDVQMDVGNGTGDLTVTVDGDDTSPSYGPSHDLLLHVGGMCQ